MAVGRLDFGSGDVADIVLEMFIILSQLTWGDMDLPPMEKGAGGTPGPTREWGAETTEGDTTNEVVRGGWDDGKGGGREQGSDGGPVINQIIISLKFAMFFLIKNVCFVWSRVHARSTVLHTHM